MGGLADILVVPWGREIVVNLMPSSEIRWERSGSAVLDELGWIAHGCGLGRDETTSQVG